MDPGHPRVARQPGGDPLGVLARAGDAQLGGLQRAQQQPGRVRIEHGAEDRAVELDPVDQLAAAERRAGHQVAVPAEVLGGRVEDQVGAVAERLLVERPQQRVVDRAQRAVAMRHLGHLGDVGQRQRRVRRHFEEDHAAGGAGGGKGAADRVDLVGVGAGRELAGRHPQVRQQVLEQVVGAAVDRPREDHRAAERHQRQQRGRDRRHARGEDGARLGAVPQVEPILEDLQVRVVEAAVDQPHRPLGIARRQPVGVGEELLALLGAAEGEGRGLEERRLDRPLRQLRPVAPAHHQRFGPRPAPPGLLALALAHRLFCPQDPGGSAGSLPQPPGDCQS